MREERKMGKGKLMVKNAANVVGIVVTGIKMNGQNIQIPSNVINKNIQFGQSSNAIDLVQGCYQITAALSHNVNLYDTKDVLIESGKETTIEFGKIPPE
jgi:hypothetical protein